MTALHVVPAAEVTEHYEATELGNARRLVDQHGGDLHHVPEWGKWLTWDGRRWAVDVTGEAQRRAKATCEAILDEARASSDGTLFKWGLRSQMSSGINNALVLASTEPGIPILVDELDTDPWLLSVANGTLNLKTGKLRPHARHDLITKTNEVDWDPDARCPVFEQFVGQIIPDPDVRTFLQRLVGYSLTGSVVEQILVFCHGAGANGKSTLMNVLLELLGEHGAPAAPRLLISDTHAEHPTSIAALHGRRCVIAQEIEQGARLDEPMVKELTGGDQLTARYMRQDYWTFKPTHKIWLCANHKPTIRGTDHGIWRRIKLIPFDVTIPDAQQDKHLDGKLRAELPGILRWAVQGCIDWQRDGLTAPQAVAEATGAYQREQDVIGAFLADTCTSNVMAKVASADLYAAYQAWCAKQGLTHPLTQRGLAGRLDEHGLDREQDRLGRSWWLGIGLKTTQEENPS